MRYTIDWDQILQELFKSGQYLHSTKVAIHRAICAKRIPCAKRIGLDGVLNPYYIIAAISRRSHGDLEIMQNAEVRAVRSQASSPQQRSGIAMARTLIRVQWGLRKVTIIAAQEGLLQRNRNLASSVNRAIVQPQWPLNGDCMALFGVFNTPPGQCECRESAVHELCPQWKYRQHERRMNVIERHAISVATPWLPWQAIFHEKYQGFLAIATGSGKFNSSVSTKWKRGLVWQGLNKTYF